MNVTIYDIANEAGVSIYTAMRALNGTTKGMRRDAKNRAERIVEIARKHNYRPNDAARSLATKRTGNLGFILASEVEGGISNRYYAKILAGVEKVCRSHGYGLHFGLGSFLDIDDFVYPKAVAGRSVDGLFLAGAVITPEIVKLFENVDIPCMCFSNCQIKSDKLTRVHRTASAIMDVLELCHQAGHRSVGIVELEGIENRPRYELIKPWLAERNMNCRRFDVSRKHVDVLAEAVVAEYLALPLKDRPTVITTYPDACMALIRDFAKHGINCPQDISLISYGSDSCCEYFTPKLTALDYETEKFGQLAAEALFDHLQRGSELTNLEISPRSTVIKGDSLRYI